MKKYLLFLFLLAATLSMYAADFPKISTGSTDYWYYLKFTQGSFVVTSDGDGVVCKSLLPSEKSTQLWKVEGSDEQGYTFTNKLGLKLYVTGTSEGSEVRAAVTPPSLATFKINASGSNFTITPFSNTNLAFNIWGGMGIRNDIKLYRSSDANAPMTFLAEGSISFITPKVNVVPYPSSLIMGEGTLDLHELTAITVPEGSVAVPLGSPEGLSLSSLARSLVADLQRTASISLDVAATASGKAIALSLNEKLAEEAYKLTITADGIAVQASAYSGFFNAFQTLRQLMPAAIFGQKSVPSAKWEVPQLVIDDAPAMSHRGFHLDISRHFFDKDEVKKLLDMASVYKLNRFHWHLTDDQGWRVEIPEYPKLTTVGAIRKASLTVCDDSGNRFFDDTEYGRGCFYTLDDLREIVAYAAERNIQIIPEIDMPGHMTACIVAYPELGCDPSKKIEVMTEGGISRDILNVGKTGTMDFLKCVLGHLAEVFPYELMHLGGDECPTTAWQSNTDCQKLLTRENLSSVNDIQPWLVEKLGSFLRDNYGKTVLVWDELLANWKTSYTVKPVVMSWRGVDYARQAADKGLYSIMVPTNPLYFDYLQVNRDQLEIDCPYNAPYNTINTVEKVYTFDPRSTVSGREQYVLGTQANLWTESCTSNREAEYQYYPRLLAVSEIAWLPTAKKDFLSFYTRLQHHANVLQAKNITYAPHYFEPVEQTPAEQAIAEAESILNQSLPGSVGYPQVSEADALRKALADLQALPDDQTRLDALRQQLTSYKNAPIVLPEADRLYKIESASTYFRQRFNGSSLYTNEGALAIHYTPQTELEEVWQFVPQEDDTYKIVSLNTGNAINLPMNATGTATASNDEGTNIVIRKATKPAGGYSYIPGVVNIKNGRFNLYAKLDGRTLKITSNTDSTLCYPGTWRIVEITDFRPWLNKLMTTAEDALAKMEQQSGAFVSEKARQFLSDEVIAFGNQRLLQAEVSRQDYLDVANRYKQYQDMQSKIIDLLDISYYYRIRNVASPDYYAVANSSTKGVLPKKLTDGDDAYLWYFVKNDDGTAKIFNKKTGTAAYLYKASDGDRVRVGKDYDWKLSQVTNEAGNPAIVILEASGANSWQAKPQSWTYIVLKSFKEEASGWELIKTDEPVGIRETTDETGSQSREPGAIYDLSGRRLYKLPTHGVYLQNGVKYCR